MNASVSRLATTSHGMMSIITRRYFHLAHQRRGFFRISHKFFSVSLCLSLSALKRMLAPGENFLRISTSYHVVLTVSRGMHVQKNYKRLFLNKTQLSSAENILKSSAQCKIFFRLLPCQGSTPGNFVDQIMNIVAPFQFCCHHQIQFFKIRDIFSRNWFWIDEVIQPAGCFDFFIHCNTSARFFAFAQTSTWKFTIQF